LRNDAKSRLYSMREIEQKCFSLISKCRRQLEPQD
jgi:hypothetical protein